jgi:hypothetical protein
MPALAQAGPSPREAPELRASDAERERAVDILRIAAGDGRLTPAELDDRLEVALTARTIGELATVTADLPGGSTPYTAGLVRAGGSQHDDLAAGRWAVLRSLLAHDPLLGDLDPRTQAGTCAGGKPHGLTRYAR